MKKKSILIMLVAFVATIANAQMYLEVTSPIKHLGSVASKDVVNDNAGNPCAKIMFEMAMDDVTFTSSNLVGSATKKIGRYECFVSVSKTQGTDITITHPSYGSVLIPLWYDDQPLVSREAYHVKIESKLFESFFQKFQEGDGIDEWASEEFNLYEDDTHNTMHRTSIPEISNLDTRHVSNMSMMFAGCTKLEELDLSNFNTTDVSTMSFMFSSCVKLRNLNLNSFITAKVTNFEGMFMHCSSLRALDLKNFNTSQALTMSDLFSGCSSLSSLNLDQFNTSNVTDMSYMFADCRDLASLNISSFDTKNVINMSGLFEGCSSLSSLNLNQFNTSNVTNMSDMFAHCRDLTSLNISSFNTANVSDMSRMFFCSSSLKSINIGNFKTEKVTSMRAMFSGCEKLEYIDMSNVFISQDATCTAMFDDCECLKTIKVSNCNQTTINKIKEELNNAGLQNQVIVSHTRYRYSTFWYRSSICWDIPSYHFCGTGTRRVI